MMSAEPSTTSANEASIEISWTPDPIADARRARQGRVALLILTLLTVAAIAASAWMIVDRASPIPGVVVLFVPVLGWFPLQAARAMRRSRQRMRTLQTPPGPYRLQAAGYRLCFDAQGFAGTVPTAVRAQWQETTALNVRRDVIELVYQVRGEPLLRLIIFPRTALDPTSLAQIERWRAAVPMQRRPFSELF